MQEYLITLKPLSPFFFGTNKTFSDTDLHSVTSSYYPQQTHILGMLRNYLLKHSGNLKLRKRGWWIENKNFLSAFNIVGGFDKNSNNQEESFGIIQNISPVFLVSKQKETIKDFHFEVPKDSGYTITSDDSTIVLAGALKQKSYFLDGFSAKEGLLCGLTTQRFWSQYKQNSFSTLADAKKDILEHEEIFQEVKQVGIRRESRTKTVNENDEGSFYNKTSFIFKVQKDGTTFELGFILLVQEKEKLKFETTLVELGAERSLFEMSFTKYDDKLKVLYPTSQTNFTKAVVLGDCFVDNFEDINYMVSDSFLPHAHLVRSSKKVSHANTNKSKQQNLIPKGSVIVLSKELQTSSQENTMIGYNQLIYI